MRSLRFNGALINQLRSWFHPKDRSVILNDNAFFGMPIIATPTVNPRAGTFFIYFKSDQFIYVLTDTGSEAVLKTGLALPTGGELTISSGEALDCRPLE